ncbi:MAG: hypothetical protein A2Y41_00390 [Spirochaetes bacterium GWB1_36_13]|nr:MAG: hypothetical protein A2Y41_00390 [Spirochaetes bacterium GWB1_36_13]
MALFKAQLTGTGAIKDFLSKTLDQVNDKEKLLKKIGGRIVNEAVLDNFIEKENSDYEAWQGLTERYKKKKLEKRGTDNLLEDTGKLKKSVGHRVENMKLIIGAGNKDTPYAASHQFGYAKKGIPARTYIGSIQNSKFTTGKKEEEILNTTIQNWVSRFGKGEK